MNRTSLIVAVVVLVSAAAIISWQAWRSLAPQEAFDDLTALHGRGQALRPAEIAPPFEVLHRAGPVTLGRLIRANLQSEDPARRATSLHLIAEWRIIIDGWETAASSPTAPNPVVAAATEFAPQIEEALIAPEPQVRVAGLRAFGALPAPSSSAIDAVRAIAESDPEPALRELADRALAPSAPGN